MELKACNEAKDLPEKDSFGGKKSKSVPSKKERRTRYWTNQPPIVFTDTLSI